MRAGAVELVVKRAMPMQHAIKDIGRDPSSRKTGDIRGSKGTLRGHGAEMFSREMFL